MSRERIALACCLLGLLHCGRSADPERQLAEARRLQEEVVLLHNAQEYVRATPLAELSLTLFEAALGPEHPELADPLDYLEALMWQRGDLDRAERLGRRSARITEVALGPTHPRLGLALGRLAQTSYRKRDYARAEALGRRGIEIRKKALGPADPQVWYMTRDLVLAYGAMGDFSRAESLIQHLEHLPPASKGAGVPELARLLSDYGHHQEEDIGDYASAERLYQRALQMRQDRLGADHPDVALSREKLGRLYIRMGAYERAEPLLREALAIRERRQGAGHLEVARSLNVLAMLHQVTGDSERAETLHLRALQVREQALGPDHVSVGQTLNNLGVTYLERGTLDRAEALLQRALHVWESRLGPEDPNSVPIAAGNLAGVYLRAGAYMQAEPLLLRVLRIRERTKGSSHPFTAEALADLAHLALRTGDLERAEALTRRALHIREVRLGSIGPLVAASQSDLATVLVARGQTAQAIPLLQRAIATSEQVLARQRLVATDARMTAFLRTLREVEEKAATLAGQHPEARRLTMAVVLLRKGRAADEATDLSYAVHRSLPEADRPLLTRLQSLRGQIAALSLGREEAAERVSSLAEQAEHLEADLARRSAPLRAQREAPDLLRVIGQVARALPADGALLEVMVFRPYHFRAMEKQAEWGAPRYLALVLLPDEQVRAVDLGPAAELDAAVARFLGEVVRPAPAGLSLAAQELYRLTLGALQGALAVRRTLYLSLDGQLQLVPFAALHDGQAYLLDRYRFTYLTSGRDLLRGRQSPSGVPSVTVLADPDFAPARPEGVTRLPGTRQEAEEIRRRLPWARLHLGRAASKDALLQAAAPGVLHVATHGLFIGEDAGARDRARGLQLIGLAGQAVVSTAPLPPLLRSVLVLSGGLATALEVAGMDLWGTQLVVLSACESGRGDVRIGEGVYGLRRAFFIAGTETLVTSLWKVSDTATRELMMRYYGNLVAGQGRVEAMRQAALAVRARFPQPYYWAPFIVLGRGDPLRGL